MSQLVPIGQMGAAGRQIVETTPNVLATYRDAQVKEQQTRQNLALGEMRLQDARNSLAEYQYKQRGQNLRTRAWSGDAQARQEYARDYPDMLSADQKQVQEALARSAPALGPAVDQAMSMYEQGAQPEQVFQFLQQNANRTGELDSIYAPAGGFGPDDVAPDQLAQFRQQLAAVMPKPDAASDVGKLLADASRLEAQGDTEGAQVLRDAARNKGRGQRRLIRSVEGGRVVFRDGSTGDVVRQGGAAPQGSAPSQRRLTINKDGSVTMEEGPGLSTTRSMQLDAEVQDLDMAVKEVDRFLANIENAPAASAGLPGIVVSNAATLAESLGIDPGEIIHRGANALGSSFQGLFDRKTISLKLTLVNHVKRSSKLCGQIARRNATKHCFAIGVAGGVLWPNVLGQFVVIGWHGEPARLQFGTCHYIRSGALTPRTPKPLRKTIEVASFSQRRVR